MYCSQHFCAILRNLVYCFCAQENHSTHQMTMPQAAGKKIPVTLRLILVEWLGGCRVLRNCNRIHLEQMLQQSELILEKQYALPKYRFMLTKASKFKYSLSNCKVLFGLDDKAGWGHTPVHIYRSSINFKTFLRHALWSIQNCFIGSLWYPPFTA